MRRAPTRSQGHEPTYVGPYTIIRLLPKGSYRLLDDTLTLLSRPVPHDQLKLVKPRDGGTTTINGLPEPSYLVERVLAHRGPEGAREYQVKWAGFKDTTWEPPESFNDIAVLNHYWRSIHKNTTDKKAKTKARSRKHPRS